MRMRRRRRRRRSRRRKGTRKQLGGVEGRGGSVGQGGRGRGRERLRAARASGQRLFARSRKERGSYPRRTARRGQGRRAFRRRGNERRNDEGGKPQRRGIQAQRETEKQEAENSAAYIVQPKQGERDRGQEETKSRRKSRIRQAEVEWAGCAVRGLKPAL